MHTYLIWPCSYRRIYSKGKWGLKTTFFPMFLFLDTAQSASSHSSSLTWLTGEAGAMPHLPASFVTLYSAHHPPSHMPPSTHSHSFTRCLPNPPFPHPLFYFHPWAWAQVACRTGRGTGERTRRRRGPFSIQLSLQSQDSGLCRDISVFKAFNIL